MTHPEKIWHSPATQRDQKKKQRLLTLSNIAKKAAVKVTQSEIQKRFIGKLPPVGLLDQRSFVPLFQPDNGM